MSASESRAAFDRINDQTTQHGRPRQGRDAPIRDWIVPDIEKILAANDGISVGCRRGECASRWERTGRVTSMNEFT